MESFAPERITLNAVIILNNCDKFIVVFVVVVLVLGSLNKSQ